MARRRVARPLAPLRALALAGAALAGLGCATPPPAGPPSEEELLARAAADSRDPWPHLGLARLYARRGDATLAIEEYGEAISRLPPRTVTTPVLELGVLHDLLGNPDAALRCFREVLDTFPRDTRRYRTNPDYRLAARGARALLVVRGELSETAALRERFLGELGGTLAEWEAPLEWRAPANEEAEGAAGAPGAAPPLVGQ